MAKMVSKLGEEGKVAVRCYPSNRGLCTRCLRIVLQLQSAPQCLWRISASRLPAEP